MKGKKKNSDESQAPETSEIPGRSQEDTDVSNLALEAAHIAAAWDDSPAESVDEKVMDETSLQAEDMSEEIPVEEEPETVEPEAEVEAEADADAEAEAQAEANEGPLAMSGDESEEDLVEEAGEESAVKVEAEAETETETENESEALAESEPMTPELDNVADFAAPQTVEAEVTVSNGNEEAFILEEDTLPKELSEVQAKSIIESVLFACVHPVTFASLKSLFHGTNIDGEKLRDIINHMQTDYAGGERGITLDEASGGYQFRTKLDNAPWLRKMVKARPFKLSGPALEVLSIIAYKQPVIKAEIDQIRGVESGHLVRALMEKNLVKFAGKSELPGKPMLYGTTKQFLELFGLRNIRELPTLSEIDKLIPEGIGETTEIEGETLGSLAEKIGLAPGKTYSESEAELLSITDQLGTINTTTEFFEQEKLRERERRDQERAQDLRERKIMGETLPDLDQKWLARFEAKIDAMAQAGNAEAGTAAAESPDSSAENSNGTVDVAAMVNETLRMSETTETKEEPAETAAVAPSSETITDLDM